MNATPLDVGWASDPGRAPDKQVNEDACAERRTPLGHLCVVCDGMGGYAGGREASMRAVATIVRALETPNERAGVPENLRAALAQANRDVWSLAPADAGAGRPGSTVVALLVHDDGAEVAHVGDSRAYLFHEGQVFPLTRDHSMVQRWVDANVLTPGQAAIHPHANQITRALGTSPEVDVELRTKPVRFAAGDVFVLCTDGLSDLVGPEDLLAAAATLGTAAQMASHLVALANARGGHDNITALVVRVLRSAQRAATLVAPTLIEARPPGPRARRRRWGLALVAVAIAALAGAVTLAARQLAREGAQNPPSNTIPP